MGLGTVWADPDHPAWFRLSAELQPLAAEVSGRSDVVVSLRPGLGLPAAAEYADGDSEIRLDADSAFRRSRVDDPRRLDLSNPTERASRAGMVGLVVLQAGVAGHAPRVPAELPSHTRRWATLLAAVAASASVVRSRPAYRVWLRAALPVSCPIARPEQDAPVIATTVWYCAQVAAGVLTAGEAERMQNRLLLLVGPSVLQRVRAVLRSAAVLSRNDTAVLVSLAEQLSEALDDPDDHSGEDAHVAADTSQDDIDRIAHISQSLLQPPSATDRAAADRQAEADLRELTQRTAHRVFATRTRDDAGTPPSPELRAVARSLAVVLRAARIREPQRVRVPSPFPPGRTRLAELMRRDAQVAARTPLTAQPWRRLRREPTQEPELRVALSWDISASRAAVHEEMCELAWATAWAARRVEGAVAAVAWNDRPLPIVWPGIVPDRVARPVCGGRSAGCPESLRALDGALHLVGSPGLRLLLIASDGRVPNRRHVQSEVTRLTDDGVTVLWLSPAEPLWAPRGAAVLSLPPGAALQIVADQLRDALAAT